MYTPATTEKFICYDLLCNIIFNSNSFIVSCLPAQLHTVYSMPEAVLTPLGRRQGKEDGSGTRQIPRGDFDGCENKNDEERNIKQKIKADVSDFFFCIQTPQTRFFFFPLRLQTAHVTANVSFPRNTIHMRVRLQKLKKKTTRKTDSLRRKKRSMQPW